MLLINAAEFVCNSFQANRVAHNARNEHYHFMMAVNKYGLKAVVDKATDIFMQRGHQYLEAASMSISRANHMLEMSNGQKTYQEVRDQLRDNTENNVSYTHTANINYEP